MVKYRRRVLYANSYGEVVLITWPSQSTSPVHNHGMWYGSLIVLEGCIQEERYDEKNHVITSCLYETGSVIVESVGVRHRIYNPYVRRARTLHCYTNVPCGE